MKTKCQAEDMGGWPACTNEATLRTKDPENRRYYCEFHRINRHVWKGDELEPMNSEPIAQSL